MSKYASAIGTLAGAGIGFAIGGFAGARTGLQIGSLIGGFLQSSELPAISVGDLPKAQNQYGATFNMIYAGKMAGEQRGGIRCGGIFFDCAPKGGIEKVTEKEKTRTTGTAGGGGAKKQKVDRLYMTCAIALADARTAPITIKKIYADEKCIYNRDGDPDEEVYSISGKKSKKKGTVGFSMVHDDVTMSDTGENCEAYSGTWNQMPSPILQSLHPEGVPAYRGICYFVIRKFALAPYNNRVPTFTAVLENGVTSIAQMISLHMELAEIPEQHRDISVITEKVQASFQNQFGPAKTLVAQLAGFAECALIERDDKIIDISKKNPKIIYLSAEEVGAHQFGSSPPSINNANFQSDDKLPSSIVGSYSDPDLMFETNTAEAVRWSAKHNNPQQIEWGIVSRKANVTQKVRLALNEFYMGRDPIAIDLPFYRNRWGVGDVFVIPREDGTQVAFFCEKKIMKLGIVSLSGKTWNPEVYNLEPLDISITPREDSPVQQFDAPYTVAVDAVALQEEDKLSTRIVAAQSSQGSWGGGLMHWEDRPSYADVVFDEESRMGVTLTSIPKLPYSLINDFFFDVDMKEGIPVETTLATFRKKDSNLILFNNGLVGNFFNVQYLQGSTYRFSDFIYGRKGSDYTEGVPIGTPFILLVDENGFIDDSPQSYEMDESDKEEFFSYTILSGDPDGGEDGPQTLYFQGASKMALPVIGVECKLDNGSITLRWRTRTRQLNSLKSYFQSGIKPNLTIQKFVIEIVNDDAVPVFSKVSNSPDITLTSSQLLSIYQNQVPSEIKINIYQSNDYLVRGLPKSFVVRYNGA